MQILLGVMVGLGCVGIALLVVQLIYLVRVYTILTTESNLEGQPILKVEPPSTHPNWRSRFVEHVNPVPDLGLGIPDLRGVRSEEEADEAQWRRENGEKDDE